MVAIAGRRVPNRSVSLELALVLACYMGLTAVLTYPTILRLGTHIAGSEDAPNAVWDIWAFRRAIIDPSVSLYTTDSIFYPYPDVAAFWTSPVNLLLSLPLTATVGPVVTYNLLFLSAFVLSGLTCYLLVRHLSGDKLISLAAGSVFSFSAYHYAHGAAGHLGLFSVQWLPLYALSVLRFHRKPDPWRALHLIVVTCLLVLTFPYYAVYFVVPFLVCFFLYYLWKGGSTICGGRFLAGLALALAVAAGFSLPFYRPFLLPQEGMAAALQQAAQDTERYSADLLAFVLPSARHPLLGDFVAPVYERFSAGVNLAESTIYIGMVGLLLALWGLWRGGGGETPLWGLLALVAFVLSLGPVLHVNGRELFPLPYVLLMKLPLIEWLRGPARISVTLLLSISVLAAYGLRDVLRVVGNRAMTGGIVVAVVVLVTAVESLFSFPYQSSSAAVPEFYSETLPSSSHAGGLFDLPSGPGHPESTSWYMYYQTQHRRNLAEGYMARTSQPVVLYPHWILRGGLLSPPVDLAESDTWPAFEACFADLLGYNGIGHVVVRRQAGPFARPYSSEGFRAVTEFLESALGEPAHEEDDLVAYEIPLRVAEAKASFDGRLELLDHKLVETTVCPEGANRCTFLATLWRALEPPREKYGFYLQLIRPDTGAVVAGGSHNLGYQYSHGSEKACYNTTWWAPGMVIADYALLPTVDSQGGASSGTLDVRVWVASPQTGAVLEAHSEHYGIDDRGRLLLDEFVP